MTSELVAERARQESGLLDVRPQPGVEGSPAVRRMRRYAELTGMPLFCVQLRTGRVLAQTDSNALAFVPPDLLGELEPLEGVFTRQTSPDLLFFALPLPAVEGEAVAGVGYAALSREPESGDLVLAAAEAGWSSERLAQWLGRIYRFPPDLLQRCLELALKEVQGQDTAATLESEIDQLSSQIEHTYEEISLLHRLTHNMQISRSPREVAEVCVNGLEGIIQAEANAVWIDEKRGTSSPRPGHPADCLVAGTLPFSEGDLGRLLSRFADHNWSRPLVKNGIENTLLGADFPGLRNLVVVSIAEGNYRSGWILSCNRSDGREFGTVEANLLNSMATILGTHVRNIDLYRQHQDLMLSFVRSLVSTLDAKDPYTRGHSERVALIGRRLGEEFHLPEDDLRDIYLSGLLHDLGKIGVDDRILRKPGKLTDDEFGKIQQHPTIGYSILKGLNNLQKILPGVRSHHETYNGKGYPDGLTGEEIPLMARILAVADAYDAMGSDRPYRKGMPVEKIEEIFRRGAGQQWDHKVVDAYFRARDDIQDICESYSPDSGNLLGTLPSLDD